MLAFNAVVLALDFGLGEGLVAIGRWLARCARRPFAWITRAEPVPRAVARFVAKPVRRLGEFGE